MQGVVDGARSLTGAQYGALVTFDDSGVIENLITSGITPEERRRLGDLPKGLGLFQYLNEIREPLRLKDLSSHTRSVGFPGNHPPMKTFLGAPVRHLDERLGNIYLAEKGDGREFTLEDEETLVLFASQAAMAIANARRYRDEQRARGDLEALVDISPVGVLVFDAKTRDLVSHNQETRRIVRGLHAPGHSLARIHRREWGRRWNRTSQGWRGGRPGGYGTGGADSGLLPVRGAAHEEAEGSKELSLADSCGASGRDLRLTGG